MPSPPASVYETILYATDVPAAAEFYRDVIGLRLVDGPTELYAALRLSDGAVLLIFEPTLTARQGRPVPSHGASGPGHVAFSISRGASTAWREHFAQRGVPIEKHVESDGNSQLYLRDPGGNSVELVEGDIWPH